MGYRARNPESTFNSGLLDTATRMESYGAIAGGAIEESVTGFTYRATARRLGAWTGTAGDLLSPEDAAAQYGVDGHLTFDKPIYEDHARELSLIKHREMVRSFTLSASDLGKPEMFAVGLVSSLIDPVGDAVAFVPYAGQYVKGGQMARSAARTVPLGRRLGRGALEGAAAGALSEGLIAPLAIFSEQRNYGGEDIMINVLLSGGLGALARGIGDRQNSAAARAEYGESVSAFDARYRGDLANTPLGLPAPDRPLGLPGDNRIFQDGPREGQSPAAASAQVFEQDYKRRLKAYNDFRAEYNQPPVTYLPERARPQDMLPRDIVDAPVETRRAALGSAIAQVARDEPARVEKIFDTGLQARAQEQLGDPGPNIAARYTSEPVTVYTPDNSALPVRYALVELDDLIASHTSAGAVNPAFPSVLQPRDRSAGASQVQIQKIASTFVPERMAEGPLIDRGPPLISPDGIVESGNGRVLVLRKMRDENMPGATAYQKYLKEQGFETDGLRFPVAVRVAEAGRTPDDRVQTARQGNKDDKASYSAEDEAISDAAAIPDYVLQMPSDGDLTLARNQDYVKSVLRAISDENDLPAMIGKDGRVSRKGMARMQAAIMQRAYGDEFLTRDAFETTSPITAAINNSLREIAPEWARMRSLALTGQIDPQMDITRSVLDGVALVRRLRSERAGGQKLSMAELIAETDNDMFAPARSLQDRMAIHMFFRPGKSGNDPFERPASQPLVTARLKAYIETALSTKGGPNIFGDSLDAEAPTEIISRLTGVSGDASRPAARAGNGPSNSADGPQGGGQPGFSGRSGRVEVADDASQASADLEADRSDAVDADSAAGEDLTFSLFDRSPPDPTAPDSAPVIPDDLEAALQEAAQLRADIETQIAIGAIDPKDVPDLDVVPDKDFMRDLRRGVIEAADCMIKTEVKK